jgi:hypothetical protein
MRLLTYGSDWRRLSWVHIDAVNLHDGEKYIGLMQKIHAVNKFLQGAKEELVCFMDGYDVQLFGTPKQIEERFLSMKIDGVIMSAEANCFPYQDREQDYPTCATRYRFVNSGCYIGKASHLRRLFDNMRVDRVPPEVNDQAIFTDYYLANPQAFTLDTKCELFQSLFDAHQDIERIKGVYTNKQTNTRPLVFHGNGGAGLLKE